MELSAAGGPCRTNQQCFSGLCYSGRCGPDTRIKSMAASGSHCSAMANWCLSRICYKGRCTTAALQPGKVGDGGRCLANYHCLNDSLCRDQFCISNRLDGKEVSERRPNKDNDLRGSCFRMLNENDQATAAIRHQNAHQPSASKTIVLRHHPLMDP